MLLFPYPQSFIMEPPSLKLYGHTLCSPNQLQILVLDDKYYLSEIGEERRLADICVNP